MSTPRFTGPSGLGLVPGEYFGSNERNAPHSLDDSDSNETPHAGKKRAAAAKKKQQQKRRRQKAKERFALAEKNEKGIVVTPESKAKPTHDASRDDDEDDSGSDPSDEEAYDAWKAAKFKTLADQWLADVKQKEKLQPLSMPPKNSLKKPQGPTDAQKALQLLREKYVPAKGKVRWASPTHPTELADPFYKQLETSAMKLEMSMGHVSAQGNAFYTAMWYVAARPPWPPSVVSSTQHSSIPLGALAGFIEEHLGGNCFGFVLLYPATARAALLCDYQLEHIRRVLVIVIEAANEAAHKAILLDGESSIKVDTIYPLKMRSKEALEQQWWRLVGLTLSNVALVEAVEKTQ